MAGSPDQDHTHSDPEGFVIEALDSVTQAPAAEWDALSGQRSDDGRARGNPFVRHVFLRSLEDAACVGERTGWLPQHLAVTAGGRLVAAVPAYLKGHSQGEYVFDHGWADAFERAGGDYYPKLQVAVPFTPATGPRLLVGDADGARRGLLAQAIGAYVAQTGISSAHATFLEAADLAVLEDAGFLHRVDHQFHFINRGYRDYQDFLASLSSRKRKTLRRERADALLGGIEVEWLTGKGLTGEAWDAFFDFYMDTGGRKWGRPYLNRKFFQLVGERMADDILLVMARRGGRYIAGALNFIGGGRLYGRYWGCIEEHPFLHFELCYNQAIDYALANGLEVVEAGAQGEHKLARGYEPVLTHSAHFIAHRGLRRAIEQHLGRERAQVLADHALLAEQTPFRKTGGLSESGSGQ